MSKAANVISLSLCVFMCVCVCVGGVYVFQRKGGRENKQLQISDPYLV